LFGINRNSKKWQKEFYECHQNSQSIIDLYYQGLKTSPPKLIEVVKGKLQNLIANPPDIENADLKRIQEYRDEIKRYERLERQIHQFNP
jgi:hypothetical protein